MRNGAALVLSIVDSESRQSVELKLSTIEVEVEVEVEVHPAFGISTSRGDR